MEGRKKMEKKRIFRPVPGLSREEEEKQLEEILEVAQENGHALHINKYEMHDVSSLLLLFHNFSTCNLASRIPRRLCTKIIWHIVNYNGTPYNFFWLKTVGIKNLYCNSMIGK